jgi:hypothetical protein
MMRIPSFMGKKKCPNPRNIPAGPSVGWSRRLFRQAFSTMRSIASYTAPTFRHFTAFSTMRSIANQKSGVLRRGNECRKSAFGFIQPTGSPLLGGVDSAVHRQRVNVRQSRRWNTL